MAIERVVGVGGVYTVADPRVCLGSCFCVGDQTTYLTANHIVRNRRPDEIFVRPFAGEPKRYERVTDITSRPKIDAALLRVAVDNTHIQPFDSMEPIALHGTDVASIGFPTDMFALDSSKETLRLFKGYVQRIFQYSSPTGASYAALELSFAVPPGLSGAPIFLPSQPFSVVGMVTENFKSYTLIDQEVVAEANALEYRAVITYGLAVAGWQLISAFPGDC